MIEVVPKSRPAKNDNLHPEFLPLVVKHPQKVFRRLSVGTEMYDERGRGIASTNRQRLVRGGNQILEQLDLDRVEVLLLREGGQAAERDQRDGGKRHVESGARHFCAPSGFGIDFIFFRYSGYIVSAPPRAASSGMPWALAYSVRNGLLPGR